MQNNNSIDLKNIKNKYGENMMHLCRELFPTLLETPGSLFNLLESNFEFSKFLYDDIINNHMEEEFKNYIYGLASINLNNKKRITTNKTPKELLEEAGYILYECKTEEDIQKFKKYYEKEEELCTFKFKRLKKCYVFFAVKKNIDEIKRENFPNPKREDEYGTSVISIQFTKGNINTLSIKNRYNHNSNIFNPDATYSNNLENIIPGLTDSFEKYYNLNINDSTNHFDLPNYIKSTNGKYYKYNYEINSIYYCPNNIIIDKFKEVKTYEEKEKYLILDYFILDLVNKQIKLYDNEIADNFTKTIPSIKNITIERNKTTETKIITIKTLENIDIIIEIDKTNKIISYKNNQIEEIPDHFLYYNESLKQITIPNTIKINNFFLYHNLNLEELILPNLKSIGSHALYFNKVLKKLICPKLTTKGNFFLYNNPNKITTKEEKNYYIALKEYILSKISQNNKKR